MFSFKQYQILCSISRLNDLGRIGRRIFLPAILLIAIILSPETVRAEAEAQPEAEAEAEAHPQARKLTNVILLNTSFYYCTS